MNNENSILGKNFAQYCGEIQIPVVEEFLLEEAFPKFSLSNGGYQISFDNQFDEIKKENEKRKLRLKAPVILTKQKILKSFDAINLNLEAINYLDFLPILKYLIVDLQPKLTVVKKQVCLSNKYINVFPVKYKKKVLFFRVYRDNEHSRKRWAIATFDNYYEVSENEFMYFVK